MAFKSRTTLILISLITLALPLTLYLNTRQHDIRQQASEQVVCAPISRESITARETITKPVPNIATTDIQSFIEKYRSSSTANKRQLIASLKSKLEERKKGLVSQMRTDPQAALQAIKNTKNSRQLNDYSSNCVEVMNKIEGTLQITSIDYKDKTAKEVYTLHTLDNYEFTLHIPFNLKQQLYSGAKITAEGYAVDQEFLLAGENTTEISSNYAPLQLAAATTKRVAVILVSFADTTFPSYISKSNLADEFTTFVNPFLQENSYNRLSYSPTFFGTYKLSMNSTCNQTSQIVEEVMNKTNKDINFTQYDNIIIVSPFIDCNWAGLGDLGVRTYTTPDGPQILGFSLVNASIRGVYYAVMSHELGHNLGAGHATFNSMTYGDIYDIMGANSGHMNASLKDVSKLFSTNELKTVTNNGTYTITPLEIADGKLKSLKIDVGMAGIYYIEYRQAIGADEILSSIYPNDSLFDGALIHKYSNKRSHESELIDPTQPISAQSSLLKVNSTYTVPGTSLTFKVTGRTSSSLTVAISGIESIPIVTPTPSPTPSNYTVSGNLFIDNNTNGVRDTGDAILQTPIQLELRKDNDTNTYPTLVTTVTSTSLGAFSIPNLPVADYMLTAKFPTNYTQLTENPMKFFLNKNTIINFGVLINATSPTPTKTPTPTPTKTPTPTIKPTGTLTPTPTKIPSPTPTRTPTPTVRPSSTPIPTPTPTLRPSPTPTSIPTPTPTRAPGQSFLNLTLSLHGLGRAGDNTSPNTPANLDPRTKNRSAEITLKNVTTNQVSTHQVNLSYQLSSGMFVGTFTVPQSLTGSYQILVKTPQYLSRMYDNLIAIQADQTLSLPTLALTVGDINGDNQLNILDYDLIIACYESSTPMNCSPAEIYAADINDDGSVNQYDYNLFLREIQVLSGN